MTRRPFSAKLLFAPCSRSKPVWIHPNTLHCFPPELQTEYAERNEEMERQYHHLMHGGTADRAGAGGGKREKGPTGKGLSITAYTRTKQHAEEAAIRAQNARRDPVSQAADVAAKRRLFTKRKNQVEREIANVRTLRTGGAQSENPHLTSPRLVSNPPPVRSAPAP